MKTRWLIAVTGVLWLGFAAVSVVHAQGKGNSNGVPGEVAALQSAVTSLTARVQALESSGIETNLCFDLMGTQDSIPDFFVGRVMLSAVRQGSQRFYRLVGAVINLGYGYATPALVFDPIFGSAIQTSTGDTRFAFFFGTEQAPDKYGEVSGLLPSSGTGSFSLQSTLDANPDIFGYVVAATCPALP
jgi:hypothetical protein